MIALDDRLRLSRRARLRHDQVRDRWLLVAPERGLVLNASALAIVRRLDGLTVGELARRLAEEAAEPSAAADVIAFVRALCARGWLERAP